MIGDKGFGFEIPGLSAEQVQGETERWQPVDRDRLKIAFTFDDPKMYARPWTITYSYKLRSD